MRRLLAQSARNLAESLATILHLPISVPASIPYPGRDIAFAGIVGTKASPGPWEPEQARHLMMSIRSSGGD